MDEQEFQKRCGEALEALQKRLMAAAESADFEADFNAGALAIEFEEPPAKFVVSPNSPVSQIWVSAHSKSFKLDWDAGTRGVRACRDRARRWRKLVRDAVGQQLGEESRTL